MKSIPLSVPSRKRVAALVLALLLAPIGAILEEVVSYNAARRAYTAAIDYFEAGERAKARSVFNQVNGYEDSGLYVQYIDGEAYLEQGELASAAITFQTLSGVEFLDSKQLYDYTQGLRAEQTDKPRQAMLMFNRASIRDSITRYASLAARYPQIDISKDELPELAKVNGYAFVAKDGLTPVLAPDMAPLPTPIPSEAERDNGELKIFDVVRTLAFAWGAKGRVWSRIAPTDKDEALGFVDLASLYLMTADDEANYAAALAANPPRTDHYAYVNVNTKLNIRPQTSKSGVVTQADRNKIVQVLESPITGEDGAEWSKVLVGGQQGYAPNEYLRPMTEAEEETYRLSIGVTPAPTVRVTPMPTQRAAAAVVSVGTQPARPPLPSSIPAPSASEEEYDLALWLMSVGFTRYDPLDSLQRAVSLFEKLGGYKSADVYAEYARFLLFIELGAYDVAQTRLDTMYKEGFFAPEKLALTYGEIPVPPADDLYIYLLARNAARSGEDIMYAIALLDGLNALDATERMTLLSLSISEPPNVEDAAMERRPRDTIKKPTRYPELSAEDLALMRALYDAAERGDIPGAATTLANPGFARIFNEVLKGETFLFDGESILPLENGYGLVLRGPDSAFFGAFLNGLPSGAGVAVGVAVGVAGTAYVSVSGNWADGYPMGRTTMRYIQGADDRTVTVNFNGGELASGEAVHTFSEANGWPSLTFTYSVSGGVVQRGSGFKQITTREDDTQRWRVMQESPTSKDGGLRWHLADNGASLSNWVSWYDGVGAHGYEGNTPGSVTYRVKPKATPTPEPTHAPVVVTAPPTQAPRADIGPGTGRCVDGCACGDTCGCGYGNCGSVYHCECWR
ncbi:MAG: SH3 domain-containing protein [Oscillospiraceae bacterium]|jgi:hypothetical protein|nr:SH3 domain-containing protein [Oscillospiraceae bacterium]